MDVPWLITRVARALPRPLVERVARRTFTAVLDRHANILQRMGEYAGKSFAFAPTDLPFVFVVRPLPRRIEIVPDGALAPGVAATISAPIVVLLALLEGRIDGDAAFFARGVEIEGDMEAVLAMRNSLDDAKIDLPTDLAPLAGPLRHVAELALDRVRRTLLEREGIAWN